MILENNAMFKNHQSRHFKNSRGSSTVVPVWLLNLKRNEKLLRAPLWGQEVNDNESDND